MIFNYVEIALRRGGYGQPSSGNLSFREQIYKQENNIRPMRPPTEPINDDLRSINRHIDFDREGAKGNARKQSIEVNCVECRKRFVLQFRPRRPEIYCDDCFKRKNRR